MTVKDEDVMLTNLVEKSLKFEWKEKIYADLKYFSQGLETRGERFYYLRILYNSWKH